MREIVSNAWRARFAVAVAALLLVAGLVTIMAYNRHTEVQSGLIRFDYRGTARGYLLHNGKNTTGPGPAPLVILFHGGGGEAHGMVKLTGFNDIADREGIIAVYPNGIDGHWNDGRGTVNPTVDDVGFVSALIDHLVARSNADPKRVYITGISNGGMFTHRVAFELPSRIAAAAPVAGTIPENVALKGTPAGPVPLMMFHGTDDRLVPYAGGEVAWNGGRVLAFDETMARWTTWNNCTSPIGQSYYRDRSVDGTQARREGNDNGTASSEVVGVTIEGGGHTWPGGFQYLSEKVIGKTCRDISASALMWDFFLRHVGQ